MRRGRDPRPYIIFFQLRWTTLLEWMGGYCPSVDFLACIKQKKHIGVKKEYKLSYSNIIDFYRIKNLGGLCKQTKAE